MTAKFWIGGTGTWDNTGDTHWSLSSGGPNNTTHPTSVDTATLDGASGGGTVTVNATLTLQSIACGAFTGTLDFSANNNDVTLSAAAGFSGSGTGTRTINLGNGLWTLSSTSTNWTMTTTTGLTFNANSSTISFTGVAAASSSSKIFAGGGLTYNIVTFGGGSTSTHQVQVSGTGTVFTTLNITAPISLQFGTTSTYTITNAFSWTAGTISTPMLIKGSSENAITISVASGSCAIAWAAIRGVTFSGGATFTATNSFDCGGNSGATITPPAALAMLYRNPMRGNLG